MERFAKCEDLERGHQQLRTMNSICLTSQNLKGFMAR